jgi:hypothetical protein
LDECIEVNLQSRNSTIEEHSIGYCKENNTKVGESRIFYNPNGHYSFSNLNREKIIIKFLFLYVIRVVEDEHDYNQCT